MSKIFMVVRRSIYNSPALKPLPNTPPTTGNNYRLKVKIIFDEI